MSGLSLWQKSQIEEAIVLLSRAVSSIDLVLSADAVDEREDWEELERCRARIDGSIESLRPLTE
jgi:hypothetical protein